MCGKNSTFTGIVLVCCLVMSVPSYGKSETFVKDGPYLGVFGAYNTIGGEFTDSVTYVYEEEPLIYYDVPNVDSAFGYGIGGGYRKGQFSLELNYERSKHDVDGYYMGETQAHLQTLTADYKIDVFAKDQWRPFVVAGIGGAWLTITDGCYDANTDTYSDDTFTGINIDAGGGLAYYLTPQWSINVRAIYRLTMFLNIEDYDVKGGNVDGSGLNLRAGLSYTF